MLDNNAPADEELVAPPCPPDLKAIAKELDETAGEIEARIAELEEGQVVTHETLQMEFGI